jgi:hemerythrin
MKFEKIAEWNDKYDVRIGVLNHQHRTLLDMINGLYRDSVMSGPGRKDIFLRSFRNLMKYTEYHFFSEERILEFIGFPNIEQIRETHRRTLLEMDCRFSEFEEAGAEKISHFTLYFRAAILDHLEAAGEEICRNLFPPEDSPNRIENGLMP